jgi:hypothetical protein
MPRRQRASEQDNDVDPGLIEAARPYAGMRMRIPKDARMSENIEDRRGDNFMYGNKLSMQKTRGQRMDEERESFTPRRAETQIDRDIDETAARSARNAPQVRSDMTPREERYTLDTGEPPPGYQKRRDMDELMDRVMSQPRGPSKDREALNELIRGYAKGGMVQSGSRRGDGICTKGHTKGRMY